MKMTDKLFRAIMRNLHAYVLLINRDFTVFYTNYYDITGAVKPAETGRVGDILRCNNALSDSRVVPAYLTDRNVLQEPFWKRGLPGGEELQKIRRDNCLMARVETAGPERIQGYSVILGDDNACYEKHLLLIPCGETEGQDVWSMQLMPAYRQELEENLPDQKNVALGGFCVLREGEQLPAGNYTIAVLMVNRVSKLKLWNTTGKYLTVELPAAKE